MDQKKQLVLKSPAFAHMEKIPVLYTCDGKRISPPLEIYGVAPEARSLALIMEDPDVPKSVRSDGIWDHWVKFNLPPTLSNIKEGEDPGGASGLTSSKTLEYVPPCPPDREHRYFFRLYSLDIILNLKEGVSKAEVLEAIEKHILQQTSLIGLYDRSNR